MHHNLLLLPMLVLPLSLERLNMFSGITEQLLQAGQADLNKRVFVCSSIPVCPAEVAEAASAPFAATLRFEWENLTLGQENTLRLIDLCLL
jgi:hypothetical protein